MRSRQVIASAIVFLALLTTMSMASADPEACQGALNQLRSARSDVADALRRYVSCLNSSDGHDDCSSEFGSLRSAQDDFESAVSYYEGECS